MEKQSIIDKARKLFFLSDSFDPDIHITNDVTVITHPVIPEVYALIKRDKWAWVMVGDSLFDAPDQFCGDESTFFSAVLRSDNTWIYSPDPDPFISEDESTVWTCMYQSTPDGYALTQFAVGETVYPIIFHPNVPGGWTVSNATGTHQEYWQC